MYGQQILLPNALLRSILRIFYCCMIILQLLGKWATEETVYQLTPTDRPKSARNCCLIELFCGVVHCVVCVVTLPF